MFERVDQLLDDLAAYAGGAVVAHDWSPQDDRIGGAIIRVASGKLPAELRGGEAVEITKSQRSAAQRFVATHLFALDVDHYRLLGARRQSSSEQLRKNYQRLMALVHPDSFPIGFPMDAASRVNKAYAVLSDVIARQQYDLELDSHRPTMLARVPEPRPVNPTSPVAASPRWGMRLRSAVPRPGFRNGLIALCVGLLGAVSLAFYALMPGDAQPVLVEARPRLAATEALSTASVAVPTAISPTPDSAQEKQAVAPKIPDTDIRANDLVASQSPLRLTTQLKIPAMDTAKQARDGKPQDATSANASATLNLAPMAATRTTNPEARSVDSVAASPVSGAASAAFASVESGGSSAPAAIAMTAGAAATGGTATASSAANGSPQNMKLADVDDLLAQFSSAFESGSMSSLRQAFSQSMTGRNSLLADYERVFQRTKQRSIHFNRMRHHPISSDRLVSSGQATVATVDHDNRSAVQRVYLEIEIAREAGGPRISRLANYEQR